MKLKTHYKSEVNSSFYFYLLYNFEIKINMF